ncbi:MAG: molybdopterin molybdotransferase MoeA [Flavobacteriaceae bacterium]|nr:molybdopterin molybdotransferase MoeA [Flavobacteriaceae bacterium]
MIPVKEAISEVQSTVQSTADMLMLDLRDSLSYVIAEDVVSPIDMPPFRQSAMDGYAVNYNGNHEFKLIGEVKAGDSETFDLKAGEAVRIFTGAAVPETSNAVAIQEYVKQKNGRIRVDYEIRNGMNIRPQGEQVKTGDIALLKGTQVNSAGIGYLASLGVEMVKVYRKPSVTLLVTGNELVDPGNDLKYGEIYESNALMLSSALNNTGFSDFEVLRVRDDYSSTLKIIREALDSSDFLLVSGGISVGDYDYVGKALEELNVDKRFYKVRQKPGKPLFFGKDKESYVFALPGNPASALSCFYVYVLPALHLFQGNKCFTLNRVRARSRMAFSKKGNRAQFLKAIYYNGQVEILEGQNSSMLHTFALANALVFIPEDQMETKINDELEVILLPR